MDQVKEWIALSVATLAIILFAVYNLKYLPVIDFLPYSKGTYIPDKMIIPRANRQINMRLLSFYEKRWSQKEFTLDNYPSDDTTWIFID